MSKKLLTIFLLFPIVANAGTSGLDDALRATYTACVGIDEELSDLKKMAGINTAVTAVGTAAGAGATAVGIAKSKTDSKAKEKADEIKYTYTEEYIRKNHMLDTEEDIDAFLAEFRERMNQDWDNEVSELRDKSKRLGNWRTGLMVGNTATNVAGAIIAGNNKVDKDLKSQIDACKASLKELRNAISRARVEGGSKEDIAEANQIVSVCGQYENVDVSKINDKAKGAMVSSIIGATTGVAGTVTSAVANSESIRKDEKKIEKTEEEWEKEKDVNTAANVLAGASTVASGVATIFNVTQINAIKKVSEVASKCTEVLK